MKTHCRRLSLLSYCLLAMPLAAVPVFIGTGSGKAGPAKGIYRADFNPASGTLSEPRLAAEYQSPGFLVQHPTKRVLLSIGAPRQAFPDGTSAVAAFAIGADFSLEFLGEASTGGKGACHLAIDPAGETVAVANYSDGKVSTIRLDARGVPDKIGSVASPTGSGPDSSRQEGPHAHGVYFNRAGNRLFVPDLGADRVWIYPFRATDSKLGDPLPPLITAPGAGPRHMAFAPEETHAYVINELDGTVLIADHENGGLRPRTTVSTLPAEFTGKNTTAEIEVSTDGRFVYSSNRGHDSIAVFQRDPQSGSLTRIQLAPCGGKHPRHFKISPCGRWLLCGHMDSHSISVLPLDPTTGKLGAPAQTVATPSPICILFAR